MLEAGSHDWENALHVILGGVVRVKGGAEGFVSLAHGHQSLVQSIGIDMALEPDGRCDVEGTGVFNKRPEKPKPRLRKRQRDGSLEYQLAAGLLALPPQTCLGDAELQSRLAG
jgi:hypothetical protein